MQLRNNRTVCDAGAIDSRTQQSIGLCVQLLLTRLHDHSMTGPEQWRNGVGGGVRG